jgi:hypothetical protein
MPRRVQRNVRVHRGADAQNGTGPMLIRAVVQARLLGVRLLTIDARVVVADADPTEPALEAFVDVDPTVMPLALAAPPESSRRSISSTSDIRAGSRIENRKPGRGVGHARELLAQGADTLASLRRPRSSQ